MQNRLPSARPVLDFTPVPRKYRVDGWTAERQRAFIAALADTGSVKSAAHRINMSPEGAYYLRRQPEAESFAAAWAEAIDHGVQSLADIAIDRARDGVSVPVFWKGEQVGEKRWYNDRLLMFILRHHLPGRYGPLAALPAGTRHPDTIAREAAEDAAQATAQADADTQDRRREGAEILRRYKALVRGERQYRLTGQVVAADYTLRQLTHIELILAVGGQAQAMIDDATGIGPNGVREGPEPYACDVSDVLAEIRDAAWTEYGDPPRPSVRRPRTLSGFNGGVGGGSTCRDRETARRAAEARIAEAQAEWEAAGTEERWRTWCNRE